MTSAQIRSEPSITGDRRVRKLDLKVRWLWLEKRSPLCMHLGALLSLWIPCFASLLPIEEGILTCSC
ncbi:hypothetical protein GOP47_0005136 [Adiantum capillus-veneris]|uniref:Uncharacterized protein n=1 Tax=Adiantum capillus-veneris TaxID=13818 RepID=A0A9D4ZMY7_ADICA|nr:hypothetical protein GOP47_0005136 [Adiantum capillus-veneris]